MNIYKKKLLGRSEYLPDKCELTLSSTLDKGIYSGEYNDRITCDVPIDAMAAFSDRVMAAGHQIKPLDISDHGIEVMKDAYYQGGDAFESFMDEFAPRG